MYKGKNLGNDLKETRVEYGGLTESLKIQDLDCKTSKFRVTNVRREAS